MLRCGHTSQASDTFARGQRADGYFGREGGSNVLASDAPAYLARLCSPRHHLRFSSRTGAAAGTTAAAVAAAATASAAGLNAETATVASVSANASALAAAGDRDTMSRASRRKAEEEDEEERGERDEEEKTRAEEQKDGRDWELAHSVAVASLNNLAVLLSEQGRGLGFSLGGRGSFLGGGRCFCRERIGESFGGLIFGPNLWLYCWGIFSSVLAWCCLPACRLLFWILADFKSVADGGSCAGGVCVLFICNFRALHCTLCGLP